MNDDDVLLSAAQVRAMFGDVSDMTLWRWRHRSVDPFPDPDVQINGRNYWSSALPRVWRERQTKREAA